jgi:hypothetical protein
MHGLGERGWDLGESLAESEVVDDRVIGQTWPKEKAGQASV